MRVIRIILRVILFVLLLILAINNMQSVEFNFLGIYTLKLPLIITIAIFTILGLAVGLVLGFINNMGMKSQISKLKKQISKQEEKNSELDNVI